MPGAEMPLMNSTGSPVPDSRTRTRTAGDATSTRRSRTSSPFAAATRPSVARNLAPTPTGADPTPSARGVILQRMSQDRGRAELPFRSCRPVHQGWYSRCGHDNGRAEGQGFEPWVSCPTHAFQACRFGRSRTPPGVDDGTRRPRAGSLDEASGELVPDRRLELR